MKLSKSAAGILSARYKSVLIKCLLANLMLFSLPAAAETISDETHANETFDSPSDGSYQINGGTFENSSIGASVDITVFAGTFTGSELDADHDIKISDGTFSESELYAGNDITISGGAFADSYIGADNITILGGTFSESELEAGYDITISDGTFTESGLYADEDIKISGGAFADSYIGAENITISGGTFTNSSFDVYNGLIIKGGKIEGTLSVDRYPDILINSDAAVVNLTWDKTSKIPPSLIRANSLDIKGNRGIFVSNTAFSSLTTSGKITANSNSFLGLFYETGDYVYHIDGKTLHTAFANYYDSPDKTENAIFSNATIVLNGDSVAGSGYYSMSSDVFVPMPPPVAGSLQPYSVDGQTAENVPLQILRKELTPDEINTAINFIWNDVTKANNESDLTDFTKAVLDSIFSDTEVPSITDIKRNEDIFKSGLKDHYEEFNFFLKTRINANVTISNNSTFVLNDNAKLINDSVSSDYNAGPASLPTGIIPTFRAGNIGVKDSTVIANGNNELSARSGNVIFQNSTLKVAKDAVLTFSSAGGALLLDSGSELYLAGKMKGNVFSDADAKVIFESSNARLDGTLSGAVNAVFNADYALSNLNRSNYFEFRNIAIMDGKTLDIGTTALKAGKIWGGTISAILTDAAKTTPIITAAAENVTIKLDMSAASSAQTTLYHITNETTGFKLGDYSTSRYAVSSTPFTVADASKVGVLSNWNGGDLYILRLGGSTAPIIDDLKNNGITVNPVIEKALGIIDLDDESLGKLTDEQQKALDKIDDLLTKFDRNPEKKYQVLREVAPSLSKFNILVDETTAKNVINVVSSRFNLPNSPHIPRSYRLYGRSGGNYEAGNSTVWAQGMYNHAEQSGTEGFSSNSAGFTAGIETWLSDNFKAGVGYSYTSTSIDSDRSDVDVYTHTGFLYAQYQPKRFYTNFFAGFGHSAYTDTTKIAKLESEYQTNTASAQIAIGYAVPVLAPEVAVRVINTHKKAYTDALGVELKSKDSTTATAVGGLKLSKHYRMRTNSAVVFTPELKAAATYDFVRTNSDRTALLPNGTSYIVQTENDKRFGIEAGAGFSFDFGNNGTVSLLYDGMFQGKLNSHSAVLNVKINL